MKIRVRFHLASGKHFMHWQIRYPNGDVQYLNPNTHSMVLHNCQLRNRPKTAMKIHNGGEKVVCAWVECDWIQNEFISDKGEPIHYNPRVTPNWVYQNKNADNIKLLRIQTIGSKLICL